MQESAHHPDRPRGVWGTVRLRVTLLSVVVLAAILGVLGSVVRYTVQADLFTMVDRTLAERAHAERTRSERTRSERTRSERNPPIVPGAGRPTIPGAPGGPLSDFRPQRVVRRTRQEPRDRLAGGRPKSGPRSASRSSWPEMGPNDVPVEGSPVGSRPVLPPLQPRVIPRPEYIQARGTGGAHAVRHRQRAREEPWDQASYLRSLAGRTVYSTVLDHGTPTRVLSLPIERRGKIDGVIQLAYPLDGVLREVNELTSTLLALVPFGLIAAGLGGAFLTGRALRPVGEIAATAARLGASNLSERLPVSGHDEFSELASSVNAMLARLEDAFDRQRRFTADASHELRTPLSVVKANTSLALEHSWPEDRYREFLTAIDSAAGRQSRIVEELLFLARADAGCLAHDVKPVCLIEALEEAAEAVSRPDRAFIRIESINPSIMASGSGSELTRLFTNLLENAARHTPPEGRITVSATADATSVMVTVADTGEGIPPEHLPHLAERFYRVDAARSGGAGAGLGLAICRSIIEAHGGQMRIDSRVGEGTVVRIRLRRCPPGT